MTKEELKLEAEEKSIEYVDSLESVSIHADVLHYSWEQITNAYEQGALDFAEPREKRIEELEKQNEKMKCCGNCENEDDDSWHDSPCDTCKNYSHWKLRR